MSLRPGRLKESRSLATLPLCFVSCAVACASKLVSLTKLGVMFHTRFSYWLSNGIGVMKLMTLVFISITGFVVLGGFAPRVPNPQANFVDPFEGRPTPYGLTSALYRIIFAYGGFDNAFNVVNEVKVRNNV
jgi:hypothetical protein